jgi:hypothetical protein
MDEAGELAMTQGLLRDVCRELQGARSLLASLAESGVELDDRRMDYVLAQVDRGDWERLQKYAK